MTVFMAFPTPRPVDVWKRPRGFRHPHCLTVILIRFSFSLPAKVLPGFSAMRVARPQFLCS